MLKILSKAFLVFFCFYSYTSFGQLKNLSQIDSIFVEWDKPNSPGCALGIFQDGKIVYAKGYGLANLEYDIPIDENSVFRIASTSKQFTAASIVLLSEKGKLSLDDNLKKFFPEFPNYAEKISIKNLLNHTSGIRDYLQLAYLKGLDDNDYYTDEDVKSWLVNQTSLNFEPGEEFIYSNSGYWLLGQIVKKVSGQGMAEYAKKEIFEPLGMTNTHFHNDHTRIVKNRASGYSPDMNDSYKINMTTLDMIGDGGIFTTINDMKKWDDAYYSSNVLTSSFWDKMTQKGVLNSGETIEYASGLFVEDYKGLPSINHGGAFVGFRAEYLRFPDEQISIVIFANRADANPSGKAYKVADILLKDKFIEKGNEEKSTNDASTKALEPEVIFELNQMTGDYEIEPGVAVTISIKNDSLNVLQNWNKSQYNIAKTKGNTFVIPGTDGLSFTFSELKKDKTQILSAIQGGRESTAKRKDKIDLTKIDLNDYVGKFYSEELDATYTFKLEKNILKTYVEDDMIGMDCTLDKKDQFVVQFGIINYKRDQGQIVGLSLDSGRVKNLYFRKL